MKQMAEKNKSRTAAVLKLLMIVAVMPFLLGSSKGCGGGGGGSSSSTPPPAPPPAIYSVTTTTVAPAAVTAHDWLWYFFNEPTNPILVLIIPEYSYLQGLVYSRGAIKTLGPMRVYGGVFGTKDSAGNPSSVTLKGGAMFTTLPEYQQKKLIPPKNRFRVVSWKEESIESTRGKFITP